MWHNLMIGLRSFRPIPTIGNSMISAPLQGLLYKLGLRRPPSMPARFQAEHIAAGLYSGILQRPPDDTGLANLTRSLEAGRPIADAARSMIDSGEFALSMMSRLIPQRTLPDLSALHPERYQRETAPNGDSVLLYKAEQDEDFDFIEAAIGTYRYYDAPGVWGSKIDLDQHVTAAIVEGLGAGSCLELGCFTGAVISLLEARGLDVAGLDASHLAFVLAYPNVRQHMLFGDLLTTPLARQFDVVLAMDILEHLNPVRFDQYIARLAQLISADGYLYLNSPMFGPDDVFGELFGVYASQWRDAGPEVYWRHLDCDELGWPKHGHLVWATPQWWEAIFARHGLVRDREVERAIHASLGTFFQTHDARRSLFVLKHEGNRRASQEVAAQVVARLAVCRT